MRLDVFRGRGGWRMRKSGVCIYLEWGTGSKGGAYEQKGGVTGRGAGSSGGRTLTGGRAVPWRDLRSGGGRP